MSFTNWIRVRDADGNQFDLAESAALPADVTAVKDYPIHVGLYGRPGKANVAHKGTKQTSGTAVNTGETTKPTDAGDTGKEKE